MRGDSGWGGGGQVGCERRIEVFCENFVKKKIFFFWGGGGGGGVRLGGGIRVDVTEK